MSNDKLLNYYSVGSREELISFLETYIPLVKTVAREFDMDLSGEGFSGDHLGLQVISFEEYEECKKSLGEYSEEVCEHVIHERRNSLFEFSEPINVEGIEILTIEIFEPKPGADIGKLRPGIEHMSFKVENYDGFFEEIQRKDVPVDKVVEIDGSKFFKTKFVNCVEIEFRSDYLKEAIIN